MCDLIQGEMAMRKFVASIGFGSVAMLAPLALADGHAFYSPYEILADYPGCAGPGMIALHVKFDAQAEANYLLSGKQIGLDQEDSCELTTRRGTNKTTFQVPCPENVAPAAPTEEGRNDLERLSMLPEILNIHGELFHCLSSESTGDENRQKQETLAGTWSAELPEPTDFSIGDGEFGKRGSRARYYPSRTEILFDGTTEVALPPYLRLFIGPTQIFDEKNPISDAGVRMSVDLHLVPLFDVSCDLGGEKC